MTEPLVRRWRPALAGLACCAVVFGAAWAWLEHAPGRVPSLERDVFTAINGWPDALRPLLWTVMQLGNFWVCVIAPLIVLAAFRRPAPAITAALATFAAWLLAKVVKEVVDRARPGDVLLEVHLRDGDPGGFGFVSGHAAVAFALATALAPWWPRRWMTVAGYALATVVAIARVYVGAHLPLDVIGGAALGVACGLVARLAVGVPVPSDA
jgi:undecaprenyl-diphosphatase